MLVFQGLRGFMVPSSESPLDAPVPSTRSCILVVEDEVLIRLMVSDELRDEGYDVIEACNADEALAVLKSAVRVDLIFSDVRMPGSLDGLGLLTEVKTTFPLLPVILTSGHLEPGTAKTHGASQFLPKPFRLDAIVMAIQRALARHP